MEIRKKDKPYGRPFRPGAKSTIHGIGDLEKGRFQDPHIPLGVGRKLEAEAMGRPYKTMSGDLIFPSLDYRKRIQHEGATRAYLSSKGFTPEGEYKPESPDYSDILMGKSGSKRSMITKAALATIGTGLAYYGAKKGLKATRRWVKKVINEPFKDWAKYTDDQKRHVMKLWGDEQLRFYSTLDQAIKDDAIRLGLLKK